MALTKKDNPTTKSGRVSVSAAADIGGKAFQQDSYLTSVSEDGSWVIAVADGLSFPEGGERASASAVRGFPQKIRSREDMAKAFREAHDRVADLRLGDASGRMHGAWSAPATTLCVVAHTPEGGTLAAWAGDSIPFLITGFPARQVRSVHIGTPHTGPSGVLGSFLGPPVRGEVFDEGGTGSFTIKKLDLTKEPPPYAILAASDGVWVRALLGKRRTCPLEELEHEDLFGYACRRASDAHGVATSALNRARGYGLSDNATTVAVFIDGD